MAFTKKQKEEMVTQYEEWLNKSQAVFLMEFTKMSVKRIQELRGEIRESGSEIHVVKNTLFKLALEKAGLPHDEELTLTTLAGFAFEDSPALAKALTKAAKDDEDIFKFKAGYLDKKAISNDDINALAALPPLPVLRAKLLGLIKAPAGKLVRTLAEPARQIAYVLKAYSEKDVEASPAEG